MGHKGTQLQFCLLLKDYPIGIFQTKDGSSERQKNHRVFVQVYGSKVVLGLFVMNKFREFQVFLHNLFIDLVGPLRRVSKRKGSTQKLIKTNTKRPEINHISISFSEYDIWRHIMRSSYNCKSSCNFIGNISLGYFGSWKID